MLTVEAAPSHPYTVLSEKKSINRQAKASQKRGSAGSGLPRSQPLLMEHPLEMHAWVPLGQA